MNLHPERPASESNAPPPPTGNAVHQLWHAFGLPLQSFLRYSALAFLSLSLLHAKLRMAELELAGEEELRWLAGDLQLPYIPSMERHRSS